MRGLRTGTAALVAALTLLGCSANGGSSGAGGAPSAFGGGATTTAGEDGSLDASDVIDATIAAGTARGRLLFTASPTDPGTDNGTLGLQPLEVDMAAEYDFERGRSRLTYEIESPDLGDLGIVGAEGAMGEDLGPIEVEVRVVDDASYVRDGSWLCPMCGFDPPDQPWPSDKWIVQSETGLGPVGFRRDSMDSDYLRWLTVIDDPMDQSGTTTIDGEEMAVYRTSLDDSTAAAFLEGMELQSDSVPVELVIDAEQRVRRLKVTFHADDRDQSYTAELGDFGTPVEVEAPPASEQFHPN